MGGERRNLQTVLASLAVVALAAVCALAERGDDEPSDAELMSLVGRSASCPAGLVRLATEYGRKVDVAALEAGGREAGVGIPLTLAAANPAFGGSSGPHAQAARIRSGAST